MKSLTKSQATFVIHSAQIVLGQSAVSDEGKRAKITAAQWPACDALFVAQIKRNYASRNVTIVFDPNSQRSREGWPKGKFVCDDQGVANACASLLSRMRQRIERSNGYVVERPKVDPVAKLLKAFEKLTATQQRRFLDRAK